MNKMHLSLSCFLILIINNAFPGGVTVGNGQGRILAGYSLKKGFMTEGELVIEAENLVQEIHSGQNEKVNKMIRQGSCKNSYSKVKSVQVEAFYQLKGDTISTDKEYVGYLKIELKGCRKVEDIQADMPYGGREFWEP